LRNLSPPSSASKQSSACHMLSRGFLVRLVLRRKKWKWYVPPKRRLTSNGLHGVISQKIELFITTAVRTSNPTEYEYIFRWVIINLVSEFQFWGIDLLNFIQRLMRSWIFGQIKIQDPLHITETQGIYLFSVLYGFSFSTGIYLWLKY
jgi:hypothetical protein